MRISNKDYATRTQKARRLRCTAAALLFTLAWVAGCLDPDKAGNLVPETVDQDSSIASIEVAGTMLHSETFGDPSDPMLMVLHGGPGADYRSLLPLQALADDGYYVVNPLPTAL